MKKKIIVMVMITAVALCFFSIGTLSWFSSHAEVPNTLTAGTVKVHIDEKSSSPILKDWDGSDYHKIIKVVNDGSIDDYVRLRLTCVWQEKQSNGSYTDLPLDINNVSMVVDGASDSSWVQENGFYYCKKILKQSVTSEPLDIKVSLKTKDSRYAGKRLDIRVLSEAVQASHNAYKDTWKIESLPDGVEQWKEK